MKRVKKRQILACTRRVHVQPSFRQLISGGAGSRISGEQNLMVLSIPSISGICIGADQRRNLHLSLLCCDTTITASFPTAASPSIHPLGKECQKGEKKRKKTALGWKESGKQTFLTGRRSRKMPRAALTADRSHGHQWNRVRDVKNGPQIKAPHCRWV